MKRFIVKLISFILTFIILLAIGIYIGVESLNNSSYFKISDKTNYIVLGHSHPACAYNDSLITNLSNFGKAGEAYYYTYLKAKKIIPNNKQIKVVFIEFENAQIEKVMDSWTWDKEHLNNSFVRYFPLMTYSDFSFLFGKNPDGILYCPPKTIVDELGFNILSKFILKQNVESNSRFGGYSYLVRDKTDSLLKNMPVNNIKTLAKTKHEISETNIKYLTKIIECCVSSNVKVFLIRSPVHAKYPTLSNEKKFKELLATNFPKIEFLDFKDFPLKNYEFGDLGHLNYKGAKVYSVFFNNLLKMNLLNKNNKQSFIDNEILTFSNSTHLKESTFVQLQK